MSSRREHNRIAKKFKYLPVHFGGLKGVPDGKINSVNKWMDQPANHIGKYKIKKTGKLIVPETHRFIRHNPVKVAKVFSGNGTIDISAKNIAKIHVVVDKGGLLKELINKGIPIHIFITQN